MNKREETDSIKIGNIVLGGQNKVLIQSMCKHKTSHVQEVSDEINECARLGASLMRVSVLDEEDARAIREIKKNISIPLIADIHFDARLALLAIESGADKIRLNPGNISDENKIKDIVNLAKEKHVAIRVGANAGSLDKEVAKLDLPLANKLVLSVKKQIAILEKYHFKDIVVSLKASNIKETIAAYRLAGQEFSYPLHIGLTEAGLPELSIIRSTAALAPLLLEGYGNTIRISMTGSAQEEVIAAKRLLHDLNLYEDYPTFISCPTCGRTQIDLKNIAQKVFRYLEDNHIKLTVAVMGCVVNGPGEAKNADLGLAGGKGECVIFKKGQIIKKVPENEAYDTLINEIKETTL